MRKDPFRMQTAELVSWVLDESTNAVTLTATSGAIDFVVYFLTNDIVYGHSVLHRRDGRVSLFHHDSPCR